MTHSDMLVVGCKVELREKARDLERLFQMAPQPLQGGFDRNAGIR